MSEFLWGIYPYICIGLFFLVPIIRMIYRPFGFSTRASGIFGRGALGFGALALHWGLLFVLLGHLAGLVGGLLGTPGAIGFFYWSALIGGFLVLIGCLVALIRRIVVPEVKAMSQPDDYIVHLFLIAIVGIALYQVLFDQIFGVAYPASAWFASIWQLSPQPAQMASASFLSKLHVFLALTFFAYFPFTKLVHFWTYPLNYAVRSYQSMRTEAKRYQTFWDFSFRSDHSWMAFGMAVLLVGFVAASTLLGDAGNGDEQVDSAKASGFTTVDEDKQLVGYPLYVSQCARCHGVDGAGKGPGASSPVFENPPRDFTSWSVLDAGKKAAKYPIKNAIRNGFGPSPHRELAMPAFKELSDEQVDSLVDVVVGFYGDGDKAEKK